MSSPYVTISVFEAIPSKFTIGPDPRPKKDGALTILYDGKIPTLSFDDCKTGKDKFTMFSFKGVEKKRVWNASTKSFTNEWDGTYGISFTLARKYSEPTEQERKIMTLFDGIKTHVEECLAAIYGEAKCEMIYNPTFEKKKTPTGQTIKTKNIDKEKGVYLSMKCSYAAPKEAATFKGKSGKDEPVFESRTMCTPFYHPIKGQAKQDDIIGKPLKGIPEAMLSYSFVNDKHYLTLRMQKCYYVAAPSAQQGPNLTIMSQMAGMAMEEEENGDDNCVIEE